MFELNPFNGILIIIAFTHFRMHSSASVPAMQTCAGVDHCKERTDFSHAASKILSVDGWCGEINYETVNQAMNRKLR